METTIIKDIHFIRRTGVVKNEEKRRYEFWLVMAHEKKGRHFYYQELIEVFEGSKVDDHLQLHRWQRRVGKRLLDEMDHRVRKFLDDCGETP